MAFLNKNATHFSGPLDVGSGKYHTLDGAYTVKNSDSGKTFLLTGTGATITLPAVKAGLNYKFLTAILFGTDYVITATSTDFEGGAMQASTILAVAAKTNLTISATNESPGDWLAIESDGVTWFVTGGFIKASSISTS